jgi:acetate kinase
LLGPDLPPAETRRSELTQAREVDTARGGRDNRTELPRILVLNAGSSSLKASVIEVGRLEALATAAVDWGSDSTQVPDRHAGVKTAIEALSSAGVAFENLAGAGHRVVHGGSRFRSATPVDDDVLADLERLDTLAPLHNVVALDTIRAQQALLPGLRAVAVFDTAFHATLPQDAYVYPLPWRWFDEWGIRRFGFHGLSVEWSVRRAAELLGRPAAGLCLVVAHLGSGCSVTAVESGRSISTSMGLTPLEGLMMGTRAGSFDAGIALAVMRDHGMGQDELNTALEHESGLLGVSGISGDMRQVQQAAADGNSRAALAIEIFVRRAAEGIAAAAASLPRLDALVFTGGIGEHGGPVRAAITGRLGVFGVSAVGDAVVERDAILSAPGAGVAVLRVEAREDMVIAEAVAIVLDGAT